ncbi:hypothetical protein [Methanimicrococcus blatticola]|uniref:hypothetical protein n=1 Tax=Methanimicrococcus blatticola TaxID=91560 RepID=UPI00105F5088|nr:hypothetical protein [Methanimicrococcus blatticola]
MHLLFFITSVRLRERGQQLPYGLRFYCHLTVCVSTATLRFAFLLPPYGLRFCRYLTVRVCCRPPCRRARPEQVLPKIEKDATFLQKSKTA